jgi:glyceraldehyde 3-phosphate dehydrogenase
MTKIKVAINGFGRIGRVTARAILNNKNLQLVAINDLTDAKTLAHLFKYDSIHRTFEGTVASTKEKITINGNDIAIYAERDPANIPWAKHDIDVVIESTGFFLTRESASKHITSGAKRVILSAPAKDDDIKTIVYGVNEHILDGTEDIISNASCTTNCATPMIKIIDDLCGIENGFLTTIHSYTGDQNLHDAPHKDLRRARAAAYSIIPTSTGAASAVTQILPHLKDKLDGSAIRVPVPDGSLTELTLNVKHVKSIEEINEAFKKAALGGLKNILAYNEDPIVSIDIVGNTNSCIFDSLLTQVIGNTIKIVGWYDNEVGYSNRLVDLIKVIK